MNRIEMIAQVKGLVKEGKVELAKPANKMKDDELKSLIEKHTNVQTEVAETVPEVEEPKQDLSKVPHPTDVTKMADDSPKPLSTRIKELGKEGLNKTDIKKKMDEEGFTSTDGGPVRYEYVFIVLKNAGITVPKKVRVRKPKAEKVEEVEKVEEKAPEAAK